MQSSPQDSPQDQAPTTSQPSSSNTVPSLADSSTATNLSELEQDEEAVTLSRVSSLRQAASTIVQEAERDAENSTQLPPTPLITVMVYNPYGRLIYAPPTSLLNFKSSLWVDMVDKWGNRSVNEELAVYRFLDLDAGGDNEQRYLLTLKTCRQ
jgi:hypothetical protein